MSGLVVGAAAALLASVLFSVGLVLQSVEAGGLPTDHPVRPASFLALVRCRRWLLGGAAMVVGFGFHVLALMLAPLTVVQPALAAGLIVLLFEGARRHGVSLSSREVVAALAIGAGVLGLTVTAAERSAADASAALLALVLVPLAVTALLPRMLELSRGGARAGLPATFGAGAAYALTGLTTKLASDRLAAGDELGAALWLAGTAIGAALAVVDQTVALQRRDATQVGVVIYLAPVLIPVIVAVMLLGETPATAQAAVVHGLSVLTVCIGAAILAGSHHVSALETSGTSSLAS